MILDLRCDFILITNEKYFFTLSPRKFPKLPLYFKLRTAKAKHNTYLVISSQLSQFFS